MAPDEDAALPGDVRPARRGAARRRARRQRRPSELDPARGARLGEVLVLAGVLSFILYSLGAAEFASYSPLRYTALTASLGWLTIAGATLVAIATGLVEAPTAAQLTSVWPQIAYLAIPGAFVAVLTWNAAIKAIGPQNAVLFSNLIPVTTFAIEIVRGYRPNAVELLGAALTIGALVASNLLARRSAPAAATTSVALPEAA